MVGAVGQTAGQSKDPGMVSDNRCSERLAEEMEDRGETDDGSATRWVWLAEDSDGEDFSFGALGWGAEDGSASVSLLARDMSGASPSDRELPGAGSGRCDGRLEVEGSLGCGT